MVVKFAAQAEAKIFHQAVEQRLDYLKPARVSRARENADGADGWQTQSAGCGATVGFIQQNGGWFEFVREGNGFRLAGIQICK